LNKVITKHASLVKSLHCWEWQIDQNQEYPNVVTTPKTPASIRYTFGCTLQYSLVTKQTINALYENNIQPAVKYKEIS